MKLVIGLGNPGEKYQNNRHNAGHLLLDTLASRISNFQFSIFNKLEAEVGKAGQDVLYAKNQTFMNESGRVVKKLIDFYKILPQNLYLVYDDLDIPLGSYKIVQGRGPRLHNGVESVKNALGTENFWHVRIGVEGRDRGRDRVSGKDYVLQNFTEEEKRRLKEVIGKIEEDLRGRF